GGRGATNLLSSGTIVVSSPRLSRDQDCYVFPRTWPRSCTQWPEGWAPPVADPMLENPEARNPTWGPSSHRVKRTMGYRIGVDVGGTLSRFARRVGASHGL